MTARFLFAAALASLASPAPATVAIVGVEGPLLANVRDFLDDPPCDADRTAVRRYAEELPERLRPALEAFGHYHATVDVAREPDRDDCWQVSVAIDPGDPVVVRSVRLDVSGEADSDPRFATLLENFPLRAGSVLRHGDYLRFKSVVDVLARERGYFDGRFTTERIDVYLDSGTADIELAFDSGPRYSFGEVTFRADALSDRVLDSFVAFDEGEPYDARLIADLQRDLLASEFFREVNVAALPEAAVEGRIPVRIDTAPAEPRSYSVGAGYSTDDGPRLRFFYENRRRNRAGHQLQADVLVAQVRQYASFDYRVPAGNPQRDWWSLRAGLARDDILAGVGAAARLGLRRTHVGDVLTVTRFADALVERDDIGGETLRTRLLVPGVTWARSIRDELVRPRAGHRLSFGVSGGLGDGVSLLMLDFSGKWITALPWDARLLIRGRLGAVVEEEFDRVPLSMRFFAGGDNSVRGYDYESLGPVDATGELTGGNRLVEASVEYEHPLLEQWALAAFIDSGNAFRGSNFETRTGVGIGARWFSPLGPVRFDVAWPRDGVNRQLELHISLGPDL